jgi:hypothetical protein
VRVSPPGPLVSQNTAENRQAVEARTSINPDIVVEGEIGSSALVRRCAITRLRIWYLQTGGSPSFRSGNAGARAISGAWEHAQFVCSQVPAAETCKVV